MKICIILSSLLLLMGCGKIKGWFGETDVDSWSRPAPQRSGCKRDTNVSFTNDCTKGLIMYFMELSPGAGIDCNNLTEYGLIGVNATKSVIIHSGKSGYFVFAEDAQGRCSEGHRKATRSVDCQQATSDNASFRICQP